MTTRLDASPTCMLTCKAHKGPELLAIQGVHVEQVLHCVDQLHAGGLHMVAVHIRLISKVTYNYTYGVTGQLHAKNMQPGMDQLGCEMRNVLGDLHLLIASI